MSEEKLKIASTAKDVRLCVIENSIFVEELASHILGNILDIDWKNSKSFGYGSTCLSFNQKLQLIQDIKGIDKDNLKAISCLTQMRNKFAHASRINSFEMLFSDAMGQEIKNYFFKRFFDEGGTSGIHSSKVEFTYRLCFYLLVHEVIESMLKINDQHLLKIGVDEGERAFKDKLLEAFSTIILPNQQLNILESFEKTRKELIDARNNTLS